MRGSLHLKRAGRELAKLLLDHAKVAWEGDRLAKDSTTCCSVHTNACRWVKGFVDPVHNHLFYCCPEFAKQQQWIRNPIMTAQLKNNAMSSCNQCSYGTGLWLLYFSTKLAYKNTKIILFNFEYRSETMMAFYIMLSNGKLFFVSKIVHRSFPEILLFGRPTTVPTNNPCG